ncbi:MAG: transglutaminaseTgpA domain-containing protein [Rubrivivax sp.]|nr:transglutaminaseTgpA domain-containing protein [Rubrivivax sp.]
MNLLPEAWRHLPRESRDTLFQLAVIAWTIAPHSAHLAPWCIALAAVILIVRARIALRGGALPSRWTLVAVLTLAVGLTLSSERTLLGKEAGVTMLVVLMALKTLELRARRDAMVVFLLGFFLVLTHFLYSQSPLTALAMLVSVWGLLTSLVLAHMPVGQPALRAAGGMAARAALLGAPIMVVLFVLFPRVAPLWGLPQDAGGHTGLSGTLALGGVAELANDNSVALRVRFEGRAPARDTLYFRGPVLSVFDGREWRRERTRFGEPAEPPPALLGQPVRYEMTVEPSRLDALPMLELTPDQARSAPFAEGFVFRQRRDMQWVADRPIAERVRVQGTAWTRHRHGPVESTLALRDNVSLPPGANPRTLVWAAALRNRADLRDAPPSALVAVVLEHIARDGYTYTLEPGPYGKDAIDEFWFDRKLGFCEHFAASFVVIMRAMDVPARIVTGYQGTDPQPADGWWVVRQSNAHAWAEVWLAGQGWVRVDPTAAVAPDRVRLGRSLSAPQGLVLGTLNAVNPALVTRLRSLWEQMDNRWNQWVLNYSRRQQFDLLASLGVDAPSWEDLAYALMALLSAFSLAGAGWALWDRHRQDPWQRLQRQVRERLALLGVTVAPHEPPRTQARRVREALGSKGDTLARTLERLDHQRYARQARSRPDPRWWRQFSAEAAKATPIIGR